MRANARTTGLAPRWKKEGDETVKTIFIFVLLFLLIIQVLDIYFVFTKNPHLPKRYKESITFRPLLIVFLLIIIYYNMPWHLISTIRRWWR